MIVDTFHPPLYAILCKPFNQKCINKLGISNSIIDCRCLIQVFIFQMSMQSLYLAFIPMLYITKP